MALHMFEQKPWMASAIASVVCLALLLWVVFFPSGGSETNPAFDGSDDQGQLLLRVSQSNAFESLLCSTYETAVFLYPDGTMFAFTTETAGAVVAPVTQIVDLMRRDGKLVKDAVLCIHNHFTPARFTDADKRTCAYLEQCGFRGVFAIYYSATGKVLVKE